MTPLYEVWFGIGEPTTSEGFNGCSQWTPAIWEDDPYGECRYMKLPLPWAKAYAAELSEREGILTEVRGIGKNYQKIMKTFGAE